MKGPYENIVFGAYSVDKIKRQLLLAGRPISMTAKAFDTLVALVTHAGEMVSKNDLMNAVWPETAVEENNLIQQISTLRKVFGERAGEHRFIVTIPGRGYSFVARVTTASDDRTHEQSPVDQTRRGMPATVRLFDPGTVRGAALAFSFMFVIALGFVWSYVVNVSRPQSLAIMQFRTAAAGDEFIGAGISDTLRARLGSVQDLTVRPSGTGVADLDAVAAGRELHVDAVLTGSVQRNKERLRVAVEMLDVADGRIVWGKTFDDNYSNMFELQDSIATEVARVLKVKYSSRRQPGFRQDTRHAIEFARYDLPRPLANPRTSNRLTRRKLREISFAL